MGTSWKILFSMSDDQKSKISERQTLIFEFILDIISVYFWVYILQIIFYEDEEREMIHFPLIKSTKAWI